MALDRDLCGVHKCRKKTIQPKKYNRHEATFFRILVGPSFFCRAGHERRRHTCLWDRQRKPCTRRKKRGLCDGNARQGNNGAGVDVVATNDDASGML